MQLSSLTWIAVALIASTGRAAVAVALESFKPAFLGVELGEPQHGGVSIDGITENSAAQRVGLSAGDVLLGIDGHVTGTVPAVHAVLGRHAAGDPVELIWRRSDRLHTGTAVLGERAQPVTSPRQRRATRILEVAQVREGQTVADVGFGGGWLAEALAGAVGEKGKVYAAELKSVLVESLRARAPSNMVVLQSSLTTLPCRLVRSTRSCSMTWPATSSRVGVRPSTRASLAR
jgi:hypothetical protein